MFCDRKMFSFLKMALEFRFSQLCPFYWKSPQMKALIGGLPPPIHSLFIKNKSVTFCSNCSLNAYDAVFLPKFDWKISIILSTIMATAAVPTKKPVPSPPLQQMKLNCTFYLPALGDRIVSAWLELLLDTIMCTMAPPTHNSPGIQHYWISGH